MEQKLLSYIPAIFGVLSIALFVFLNNSRNIKNRLFFMFNVAAATWLTFLMVGDLVANPEVALWCLRFALCFASIAIALFYIFSLYFPYKNKKNLKTYILLVAPVLITGLISLTPFLVSEVNIEKHGVQPINNSFLYTVFDFLNLFYLLFAVVIISLKYKTSQVVEKKQIKIVLFGLGIVVIANIVSGLIFTMLNLDSGLIFIGGFSVFVFSLLVAYSIVKHKFFDVRLIVARSVGYVVSIGILVVGFAILSSLLSQEVFSNDTTSNISTFFNIVFLTVAVLVYPPLKRFFDKYTNKIFYKDGYDPQEFLDQLNKNIVSNIELGILLRHTSRIIQDNLKSSFCQIAIHETENANMRIIGTTDNMYTSSEIAVLHEVIGGIDKRTVGLEDIPEEQKDLRKMFKDRDIELVTHLTAKSYGKEQTIAYIIFGAKKSGNVYSGQDLKIIEIISDELVIAIQNALRFEEIQEFNVTLQKKVNDATGKLRKTNEKLKSMDETKDEFISMASHQLRTPLTSVKGYLSMVLEGDAGEINDNQRKLLDQAYVSSQRMVYLIADLLNVSRLRTGKFIIDAQPTNLADVVETEIAQLIEQAKAKEQELIFEKPADFPLLMIDETKIRQVIMNFADNALFYTPSGGKIRIELTQDKNHVYFAVKDNGIGVPKDEQKHMFSKFYRAKNARNARPDGTGLGLFMAKKVITAQGGNILFESVEGKGSTFGFSFNKKHLAPETYKPPEEANLSPTNSTTDDSTQNQPTK